MQYKLPRRRFLPILIVGALVAAILSFYIASRRFPAAAPFFPYVMALFVAMALYTVGRFLVFDTLYQLGDDYADLSFRVFRLHGTTSTPIASLEFTGKEELIAFTKKGRKRLKKKKKLGVYTANLFPKDCYALLCSVDDTEGYLLLELDAVAKDAIADRISRAGRIYSFDEER